MHNYIKNDIPGPKLVEPYEQHTVAALRWWLLCRYYCPYTIWKVSRTNSCAGFQIIVLQRKLFQPQRSSVFLPWNAMEGFFLWVCPASYALAWHFARTALLIVQTKTIQRLQTRSRLLVLHCIRIIEVNGLVSVEREF